MPEFYVILVEPKYSGNVGAVARSMGNFDFEKLYLINPCKLDDECYARSMHSYYILDNAKIFSSFRDGIKNIDYLVATSSIENKQDRKHLRNPVLLEDFAEKIYEIDGKVGLVFGREDYGLFNKEIASCDIMVRIPSSEKYLSLNLSHAVNIVLYTLFVKQGYKPIKRRQIGNNEKDIIFETFSRLLDYIGYPEHRKEKTNIMFRRIMGRAMPSKWEYHTLMGIFKGVMEKISKK